jgi:class 3 adenylate cyclase
MNSSTGTGAESRTPPAIVCSPNLPAVLDAVYCAIEIQKTLANVNEVQPEARSMRFRIGINVGDIMAKDGDISTTESTSPPG